MENHVLLLLTSQNVTSLQGIAEAISLEEGESFQLKFTKDSISNCHDITPITIYQTSNANELPATISDSKLAQVDKQASASTICEENNDLTKTVAVQVDETVVSVLPSVGTSPPRRITWPLKFKDYMFLCEEDETEEEYSPNNDSSSAKKVKGKPGRPRKVLLSESNPPTTGQLIDNKMTAVGPPKDRVKKKYKSSCLFICEVCSKEFSQKGNLKAHLRVHSMEKPFLCKKCNKAFKSKEALLRHQFIHTGEKPFLCDKCKLRFSSALALKEHQTRHTNEVLYRCDICQRGFRHRSGVKRHLTVHTKETPFSCNVCGRHFSQKVYLRLHLRIHTGEKPYACSTCNKSFSHMSDLKRHKVIHTGQRPFSCKYCSASFTDPSSNRRHEREHISAKTFVCQICNRSFKRSEQLKHHMLKNHTVPSLDSGSDESENHMQEVLIDNECVVETSDIINDNSTIDHSSNSRTNTSPDSNFNSRTFQMATCTSSNNKFDKQFNNVETLDARKITETNSTPIQKSTRTNTTESSSKDTDEHVGIIKHLLNMPSIMKYINTPDFSSQEYYDWLSNFVLIAKLIPVPMENEVFGKISQVHKTLTDVLAEPSGILSNKENFEIVLGISKHLYDIISAHLTQVYNSFGNPK